MHNKYHLTEVRLSYSLSLLLLEILKNYSPPRGLNRSYQYPSHRRDGRAVSAPRTPSLKRALTQGRCSSVHFSPFSLDVLSTRASSALTSQASGYCLRGRRGSIISNRLAPEVQSTPFTSSINLLFLVYLKRPLFTVFDSSSTFGTCPDKTMEMHSLYVIWNCYLKVGTQIRLEHIPGRRSCCHSAMPTNTTIRR